ncbi:hypothetical protein AcdelDRAFT_3952, partial [Acidovorax delafieldii 2AN]
MRVPRVPVQHHLRTLRHLLPPGARTVITWLPTWQRSTRSAPRYSCPTTCAGTAMAMPSVAAARSAPPC